ncbi:hypothetical protein D8674_037443 [Pyrus ussuriensis x Pyrus communis]|uniref:Uncharacterized protein n=1 Tax=Pyrus ussuriensis x Pyrus communis TaxID=2448454 RepID=A0A5N5GXI4_9ROSA|nr:hypothetical protein D8674_037443 [Pyrus ussuriensis x Pyrus communis]
MSNLNKLDFTALEVSERNYLKKIQDVKHHLTAKGIRATIKALTDNKPIGEAQKVTAMIFIRRHIHNALHIKKTYTCLKQDTTGSIFASKTLSS